MDVIHICIQPTILLEEFADFAMFVMRERGVFPQAFELELSQVTHSSKPSFVEAVLKRLFCSAGVMTMQRHSTA